MEKKYRPKKVTMNTAAVVGGLISLILFAITCYCTSELAIWVIGTITGILAGILTPILLSFLTSYIVDNDVLILKVWFGKTKIDIADIKKIKKTNFNGCLEIHYKKYKQATVCLKDGEEFINDLKSINPDIEVVSSEKKTKKS